MQSSVINWFHFYQCKMTQYSNLNVKLSNSQLNKGESATNNESGMLLRLLRNMIGDDETNFSLPFSSLTIKQVANLRKTFTNKSSTNIRLSKTQLSKMIQSKVFLGRLLGQLLKTRLPLIKYVIKPLTKIGLVPL